MQNVFGLVSGMDTASIINAVAAAQRAPIQQIAARRSGVESQISAIGDISSKLGSLKTLMEDFQDVGNILALSTTTSDEDVLTATANGEATAGSYSLNVTSVARADKDRSVGYSSEFAPVKEGTLTIETAEQHDLASVHVVGHRHGATNTRSRRGRDQA